MSGVRVPHHPPPYRLEIAAFVERPLADLRSVPWFNGPGSTDTLPRLSIPDSCDQGAADVVFLRDYLMGPAFVVGANKPYLAAGELGVRMVIVLDLATPFDAIHPIIDMIAEHKVSRIAA